MKQNLFEKFGRFGVLPRDSVRNDLSELRYLLKNNFARKAHKKGRVFYELTQKSLPLLEECRQVLLHKATLQSQLTPHSRFYRALLGNLRFLNEKNPCAREFQLLGDWHLMRPVVSSQLKLSQMRYYREQGLS